VSQFVKELVAAPDHSGIGAQVSAFAEAQHSTTAGDTSQTTANIAASEVQNNDPLGSAVSQFVHEQLAAPDHSGIGAQVSALAQAQHGPNQNGDPQDSAVSQFVHELLAAPDHSGIGAQVSAFAQAQHTPNQTGELEASLEMGGRFSENSTLDPGAHAMEIDHAVDFSGTVSRLDADDVLDLADLAFESNTTLGYAANSNNTGGTLTASDGTHTTNIALLGQYTAASFVMSADGFGTLIHDVAAATLTPTLIQPHHA
jgi:hypothetical protein